MKSTAGIYQRFKRNKLLWIVVIAIFLALIATFIVHSHTVTERKARRAMLPRLLPAVQLQDLGGGSSVATFTPTASKRTLVIVTPPTINFPNKRWRKLSFDAASTIVKIELSSTDCQQRLRMFNESLRRFAPAPDGVVGLDEDAGLARHWLSEQNNEQAMAVSFSADHSNEADGCTALQSGTPPKGIWHDIASSTPSVWVNGTRSESVTAAIQKSIVQEGPEAYLRSKILNIAELNVLNKLPLIEVPTANGSDTLTVFYSGDGGWRGIDKKISGQIADAGISVVGVDALEYFWDFKTPEQSALELSQLMEHYRQVWCIKHFILAGYSFGADVIPFVYNRLPANDQADIQSMVLLSFARSANFEIRLEGMIGKDIGKFPTGPEMAKLPAGKVLCVYGTDEAGKSGCTESTAVGQRLPFPGNHHFNEDYETISEHLIEFFERPQGG